MKYFSGTGTYTKVIRAPASWFQPGSKLWLDLGDVKNIAEVSINGTPLGTVWKADLLGGVIVIKGQFADGTPLLAIPNYARLNRGGRSVVWMKQD